MSGYFDLEVGVGEAKDLRGEIGGFVGPDEGTLTRSVSDQFDGHFLGGSRSEESMMRIWVSPPRFFFFFS